MDEKGVRETIKSIETILKNRTHIAPKCLTCGHELMLHTTDCCSPSAKFHLLGILRGLQVTLGEAELPTDDDYKHMYFPE